MEDSRGQTTFPGLLIFLSLIIATIVGRIIYGIFEKPIILRVIKIATFKKPIRVFAWWFLRTPSEKRLESGESRVIPLLENAEGTLRPPSTQQNSRVERRIPTVLIDLGVVARGSQSLRP